ncbi:MAG: hypothetical protein K0R08_1998, partial [Solimicrobium sp.]|nr:hypothetical protein [Solimicrobium sp.]
MIGINHSPSGISFSAETATSHSSCGVQEQLNLTRAYALKEEQLYSQAFDLFKQLAEKNNAVAQNELGLMYENGLGVSQDFREARACYEIAAKQGSAAA